MLEAPGAGARARQSGLRLRDVPERRSGHGGGAYRRRSIVQIDDLSKPSVARKRQTPIWTFA